MRHTLENRNSGADTLKAMLRNLISLHEKLQAVIAATDGELRDSHRSQAKLQAQNEDLTLQSKALQNRINALEKTVTQVREKASTNLLGEQNRRHILEEKNQQRIDILTKERDAALESTKESDAAIKARKDLETRVATLTKEHAASLKARKKFDAEARARIGALTRARDNAMAERDNVTAQRDNATTERDNAIAQRDSVTTERDNAIEQRDNITAERDNAIEQRDNITAERDKLKERNDALSVTLDTAQQDMRTLADARDQADTAAATSAARADTLENDLSACQTDIALLGEEIGLLHGEISTQKAGNAALKEEIDRLNAVRQAEVAELGTLLDQKDQVAGGLAATQARQAVLDALKGPHERQRRALQNRLSVRTYKQARDRLTAETQLVKNSDLFDTQWYKTTYPDIGDQDPAQHFAQNGLYELRNPSAAFDSLKYHLANPDVTESGIPALLHYLRHGKDDGRPIHPVD